MIAASTAWLSLHPSTISPIARSTVSGLPAGHGPWGLAAGYRPDRRARPHEYLADVVKSCRIQVFCAWCGPAFTVLLFGAGGWGLMAGFIPLISADDSLAQVAGAWRDHHVLTLLGLTIAMFGIALTLPFHLVISVQMRRTELRLALLSILQLAAGIIITRSC